MLKRAEEILKAEVANIAKANNLEELKTAISKLVNLSDVLDSMGATADADIVDALVKEAGAGFDFFTGLLGSGLTTEDQGGHWFGTALFDAIRSGDFSKVLNRELLVKVITRALIGGGISAISGSIVRAIAEEVGLEDTKALRFLEPVVSTGLSYAVMHTDFVNNIADTIVAKVNSFLPSILGKKPAENKPQQQPQKPAQPVAQPEPAKGGDTATFQIAAPGAKV